MTRIEQRLAALEAVLAAHTPHGEANPQRIHRAMLDRGHDVPPPRPAQDAREWLDSVPFAVIGDLLRSYRP
ncbi:hypothetical protein LY622_21280 [Halomonas sp. M5N1S17]|uniref:hypothetical protein n=1 Tax=Halomonas alkalisoli TaxID=2907158 RepID=UPI001F3F7C29|nr:hypothetical protein [Halomonas alkalisoli]MCE9665967.1 hypothetical protein [Halomonas alkalisoli]